MFFRKPFYEQSVSMVLRDQTFKQGVVSISSIQKWLSQLPEMDQRFSMAPVWFLEKKQHILCGCFQK